MFSKKILSRLNELGNRCRCEEGQFVLKNGCVSGFFPYVDALNRTVTIGSGCEQRYLEIIIWFPNSQYVQSKIDLDKLKHIDFQLDVNEKCYVEDEPTRKALIDLVQFQLSRLEGEKVTYLLDKLGYAQLGDGSIVYNAGNRIIGAEGINVISNDPLRVYNLAVDPLLSNRALFKGIQDMLNLRRDTTPVLFSYFLLALLRTLFQMVDVPIRFCMYLVGESQTFKTTLATYYCALYNRDKDVEQWLHNLTGTETGLLAVLNREKDCVCIIDDLNKSDSSIQERNQEAKISTLIRVAANNVGKETVKGQDDINSQLLLCGEYLLENESTNNRLVVLMLEPGMIDKAKLTEIEKNPIVLSTFADRFIQWVLRNYNEVCKEIKCFYQDFIRMRAEEEQYQERLNRSVSVLRTAFHIFLNFCIEENWAVDISQSQFDNILSDVLYKQIENLHEGKEDKTDYIVRLYAALLEEEDTSNYFDQTLPSGVNNFIYYDEEKGLLYVTNSRFNDLVQRQFDNSVTIHELVNELDAKGFLEKDKNKGATRQKKKRNCRCYVIRYDAMRQYLEDEYRSYPKD